MKETNGPAYPDMPDKNAMDRLDVSDSRLRLAALREDEIPPLLPLFNEPEAAGFYVPAMIRPYNLEQLRSLLADWNDRAESYVFAIRAEDVLVGIANIDGFSWANSHAEIGIALIDPRYRGQGYASAAIRLLLDYLFHIVGLRRVFCRIMQGNEASMKLFLKAGFKEEGIMRSHVRRNGGYIDMHLFGLLAEEWQGNPPQ